jgi:hypothetical protein
MYRQPLVSDCQQSAYSFPATEYVKKEVESEQPAKQLKEKGSGKPDYSYWSSANVLARYRASLSPEELAEHYKECEEKRKSFAELPITGDWYRQWKTQTYGFDYEYYKRIYGE